MAQVISIATIVAIGVQKLKTTGTLVVPTSNLVVSVVSDATLPVQLRGLSIVSRITLANDRSPFPIVYYSTTAASALVTAANA